MPYKLVRRAAHHAPAAMARYIVKDLSEQAASGSHKVHRDDSCLGVFVGQGGDLALAKHANRPGVLS